jgi:hypothetical protein
MEAPVTWWQFVLVYVVLTLLAWAFIAGATRRGGE